MHTIYEICTSIKFSTGGQNKIFMLTVYLKVMYRAQNSKGKKLFDVLVHTNIAMCTCDIYNAKVCQKENFQAGILNKTYVNRYLW